jgi:hypothetical protein
MKTGLLLTGGESGLIVRLLVSPMPASSPKLLVRVRRASLAGEAFSDSRL